MFLQSYILLWKKEERKRMDKNMEQLYYSCIRFCESFTHLICEEQKMQTASVDDYTRYRVMEFERERLKSAYERLINSVEKCEKELQEQ